MIRCPTIDREMPVKRCLEYQQPRIGEECWNKGELTVYPCCTGCGTGELLRLGKVDEAIKSAEKEEMVKEKTADETAGKETQRPREKQCKGCKKIKPLEKFAKDKKAKDGHRGLCLECNRIYQQDWRDKKVKALVEAERVRQEARLIEEYADTARQRMEEQAEPSPGRETAAPACPQNEDLVLENQLLLDFSCYPEVLKEIKRIAHHEERPPEVQARFMLKRVLQDGWGDEVGAACELRPPLTHYERIFHHTAPGKHGSDVAGGANG